MYLSIIIPAYNCESTIAKCLDSIICKQDGYEIIVINDGSTDKTSNILEDYSKKYEELSVYNIPNSGVSEARNLGITKAKGEYISFIDSDDYVAKNYVKSILSFISSDKDLYFFKGIICDEEDKVVGYSYVDQSSCTEELRNNIILGKSNVPWDKVFKKSIVEINFIRFRKDISLGEDWIFTMDYIDCINDFEILDNPLYYYIIQQNSLSNRNMTIEMFKNQIYLIERLLEFGLNNYESNKSALQLITSASSKLYNNTYQKDEIFDLINNKKWYREITDRRYNDFKSNLRKFLMKHKYIRIISILFGKK